MAATASETLMATYNFAIEIDSATVAFSKEAKGLSTEVEVITRQVVDDRGREITERIAGHLAPGEVTLTGDMDGSTYLTAWFKEVTEGKSESYRRNGSIVMFDSAGSEVARWNFVNGWPKSWSLTDLDAGADNVATEAFVITHEGLTRK